jgi:cyclophilin family peptidyl-prolyl cis-trans isomerase
MLLTLLAGAMMFSAAGAATIAGTAIHTAPRPAGDDAAQRTLDRGARAARGADSLDVVLYARVLRAADQRALDTALVTTALSSPDAEVRRAAARMLSQVAPRNRARALPLLRGLTHDADSVVASAAVFGLGLVRDTASVALLASLFRDSGTAAASAAWALGEIGAPASSTISTLLRSAAGQKNADRAQRASALALLIAASKIRPLDVPALAPYADSHDAGLRWAAAYAVARQRTPAGARMLLNAIGPDAPFRAELARELSAPTVGDSLRDSAIARLRALATDADPHVRISAIRSIATFGTIARPVLFHALRDRDANVRVTAAQSATSAFGTDRPAWQSAWAGDTTFKVRRSLLESAARAGVALPGHAAWSTSSDWLHRSAAVAAWSGARDTAHARAVAMRAVRDPDGRVRGVGYGVLMATDTARRDSAVQRVLRGARSDPDSVVRNSVPGARARTLDTAAVNRPLAWYEDAVRRIVAPSLSGHPLRATIRTVRGPMVITFDGVRAPLTVLNFTTLATRHAYDNLRFHRVVPGFVAQDGDPRGDGEGGPGYAIRDELTLLPYDRGTVGMALSGPDTGGSQYFLTLTPQPHLTGHYTVFGQVTSGLSAMDALVEGDAITSVRVHR